MLLNSTNSDFHGLSLDSLSLIYLSLWEDSVFCLFSCFYFICLFYILETLFHPNKRLGSNLV